MIVFYSLSFVIGMILLALSVCIGGIGILFSWIAENKVAVVIGISVIILLKVIIFAIHSRKISKGLLIFICCPIVHIPLIRFVFILAENVLKQTNGLISVFLSPIGRFITVTLMLMSILIADIVFFTGGIDNREDGDVCFNYIITSIVSIIFSIIVIYIYTNW